MSGSSFITNEGEENLKARFCSLIQDGKFFDCLVGYFYLSGFHAVSHALEKTEKIRILIGIGTDKETFHAIENARQSHEILSHFEVKEKVAELVENEMADSEDTREVEEGVRIFIEWLKNGKLAIRAYPSGNLHAKLYIVTFPEGDRDKGRVITGSSNFTKAGLQDNLEFNVELQRPEDYNFALQKFNELWAQGVDVSEKIDNTVQTRTWLNPNITPYELYLKFLYEHFKAELHQTEDVSMIYLPEGFKEFEYQ